MEYIQDGVEWFTAIVNINGQWYKKPEHGEWADYEFISDSSLVINELPSTLSLNTSDQRDDSNSDSLDSGKQNVIDLLDFITRWYPYRKDEILENIDTVRRNVINSSIQWNQEMLEGLIPVGTYPGVLSSAELWNPNYILRILNNILRNLMQAPEQERPHVSFFPQTASGDWFPPPPPPHHHGNPNYPYASALENIAEPDSNQNYPKTVNSKPVVKYYVAYNPELIYSEEFSKKECYKQIVAYHARNNKEFLIISEEESAQFGMTVVSNEFYEEMKKLKKHIDAIKRAFGIYFMPGWGVGSIAVEKEDNIEVYQLEPCDNNEKFNTMKAGGGIEIWYSTDDDDSIEFKISYGRLFAMGVRGLYDMNVENHFSASRDVYFPRDSGSKPPTRRNTN